MPLFERGDFTLASGVKSPWKIECDALTLDDWGTLALMLAERLPPFSVVYAVPDGGLLLAEALDDYASEGPALVVDDVWTTGGSMQRYISRYRINWEIAPLKAVVFARTRVPEGVVALFTML